MLHTPYYDVRSSYCGPTAISAVTGERVSLIKELIRMHSGKRRVVGVSNNALLATMASLGWRVAWGEATENRSCGRQDVYRLGDFLDDHGQRGPFIVNVTGHYIAVGNGEVCDTFTKLPMEIARWRKSRAGRWVQRWWQFEKVT